jgi:tetratricopeptide (TPR) repeat protein
MEKLKSFFNLIDVSSVTNATIATIIGGAVIALFTFIISIIKRKKEAAAKKVTPPPPLQPDTIEIPPQPDPQGNRIPYLSHLPNTDSKVFGREDESDILDSAYKDDHTRIISFIAPGGVGKSAIINSWLNKMDAHEFKEAELIYGWSFYSQGTKENTQASSDEFMKHAFKRFGYNGNIPDSPHEKGALLAKIISKKKIILILDGLEPLQHPPGPVYGLLKDQALSAMLKNLVRCLKGLCIITSRCPVEDLKMAKGKAYISHDLENLDKNAGMEILKNHEIKGPDKELQKVSEEFKGHALALNLLGSFLKTAYNCDIRQRDKIERLTKNEKYGGHAKRVMDSYIKWFKNQNMPELEILFILGLFDRPASIETINILIKKPSIKGLTEKLAGLSEPDFQKALSHLKELRLIEKNENKIDAHPLIREHFGEKLEKENKKAFKKANLRLYEYYKNFPEKDLPDTLEEMEPLFAAVKHGCLAGKHEEARKDVYWNRILRKNESYNTNKLGAFGSDLACISYFFESLWNKPVSTLSENDKAGVLNWAGFALRALGRLNEAKEPVKAGMDASVKDNDWKGAAQDAGNLSELMLLSGNVNKAAEYGEKSVKFADKSKDEFQMEGKRTTLADALHNSGKLDKAYELFKEAESMQEKTQPDYPYLYSLQGFQYCDLLISLGKFKHALKRGKTTLEWEQGRLLDIAHDNLTIGRSLMLICINEKSAFSESQKYLDKALNGLREAGAQEFIVKGLFACADLYMNLKEFAEAWKDLDEAFEIAQYGNMKLYLADYYINTCRLIKEQIKSGDSFKIIENNQEIKLTKKEMEQKYKINYEKGKKLVIQTGYLRRIKNGELQI